MQLHMHGPLQTCDASDADVCRQRRGHMSSGTSPHPATHLRPALRLVDPLPALSSTTAHLPPRSCCEVATLRGWPQPSVETLWTQTSPWNASWMWSWKRDRAVLHKISTTMVDLINAQTCCSLQREFVFMEKGRLSPKDRSTMTLQS
ncbi:hypothetical protein M3J09_001138 [Ascochyta lentis]